jgi:hypothetical protein
MHGDRRPFQVRAIPEVPTEPGPQSTGAHDSTAYAITLCSLAYATVRYNVFKGVLWSDWPVYVVNKAVALSSLLLLLAWILRARLGPDDSSSSLLSLARRFALVHAGLSLVILSPAYFPTFFSGDRFNWPSGLSVVIGIVAASGLCLRSRPAVSWPATVRSLGVIGFMAGIHAMLNGYGNWLAPATWPGYLAPITLIAFAAGVVSLGASLRSEGHRA